MTNRERLRRAIHLNVSRACNKDLEVDVTGLAIQLSSKYQQSGVPLDAICAEIQTALAARKSTAPLSATQ
jgi:hypothetical protein